MRELPLAPGYILFENPKKGQVMKATHAEVECEAIDYTLCHWLGIRVPGDQMLLHQEKV